MRRIRNLVDGFDLMGVIDKDGATLDRLAGDPVLLADVLYAICKPEADQAGISADQFGEALAGDALDLGAKALLEAVANFSPGRTRTILTRVLREAETLDKEATEHLDKILADPETAEKIHGAMRSALGLPSTNAPESSA